jgi:hypothetical protein
MFDYQRCVRDGRQPDDAEVANSQPSEVIVLRPPSLANGVPHR